MIYSTLFGVTMEEWVEVREIAIKYNRANDMLGFFNEIIEENKRLRKTMEMRTKDHCEKCGCNEFLCGHNARE
tara:strand:- start:1471 stop:1689 length:219 start_codon:yes stop_codon:yes gene_type:complete